MTKSATVSKKPRELHSPEFRSEALKLAERIGVAAAARHTPVARIRNGQVTSRIFALMKAGCILR